MTTQSTAATAGAHTLVDAILDARQAAANGDDSIMREYILGGTPRMPAFKHYLNDAEIDAIISYVRTVPTPAPAR